MSDLLSVVRRLYAADIYYLTPRLLAGIFDLDAPQAYALLERLTRQELVVPVEKGKYLLVGLEPERVLGNPLFIAPQLAHPSYVSYWSALHYHGLTEQVPHTVLVATTRKKRPLAFQGHHFRYVTIKPGKFFGYRRESVGDLPVVMADPEKALIDSLDQPRYAGGMAEVAHALATAAPDLDTPLLLDYAARMNDRSLASRLGYLLAAQGIEADGLLVSATPVLLDPHTPAQGDYDARWRVRVNLSQAQLYREGIG